MIFTDKMQCRRIIRNQNMKSSSRLLPLRVSRAPLKDKTTLQDIKLNR